MNILYTHNLHGNLAHLPHLYTHIKHISAGWAQKPLLIDLGASCHPSVWHCDITQGRSMLIVLDAMGYHVAHVHDVLTAESRNKLLGQVSMALVDDDNPYTDGELYCATTPHPTDVTGLKICLSPTENTYIGDGWLHLQSIVGDALGIVQIANGVITHHIETIPPKTLPDTTVSGVVDFVLGEARYYQTKR